MAATFWDFGLLLSGNLGVFSVENVQTFVNICENLCIDTSAGCLFGQGACLTCLLYVRDVQVFPEQSSMFFLEILFCRRSELA